MYEQNRQLLSLFLSLALLFSLSGCTGLKKWEHVPVAIENEKSFYVTNHGWHTGITVASKDLNSSFDFLKNRFGSSEFYEFGWGDKAYYQAKEVTSGITAKALLWPTDSVIHVVALSKDPKLYFPQAQSLKVKVSSKGLANLSEYILNTFKRNREGSLIPTKKGHYSRSYFYEAVGSFYMTNTCNSWSIRGLERAGLPVSSFLTVTANSVMGQTQDAIDSYPKPK